MDGSSLTDGFSDHSNCLIGNELWIWGGYRPGLPHDHDSVKKRRFTSAVNVLDLSNATFNTIPTTGTPPNGTRGYSCCCIGNDIYYFGGLCGPDDCYHNNLFILNSRSGEWREIECDNAPMKKHGCGMIPFSINGEDYILVIGGCGSIPSNSPSHAKYTRIFSSSDCYTNEVHIMCVSSIPGKWTIPMRTGSVFPPLASFSINTFPGNRAIIFGGESVTKQDPYYHSNDVFILSYNNNIVDFRRLILDPNPSIQWPMGRSNHSSVTITSVSSTGERKHYLVVLGGIKGLVLSNDTWILDIERKEWKQITLPEVVVSRRNHSMSCYQMSVNCVWLIITGGSLAGLITTPNRLMIVELDYSPFNDIWTVRNVLDEHDMKNQRLSECKREYHQRSDDGFLDTGGNEQVQLLKQLLKQGEEEITRVTAEFEQEKAAHTMINQRMNELIQQKNVIIHGKNVIIQQNERLIQERDVLIQQTNDVIREKDVSIQCKDEIITEKDVSIQQKEGLLQDRDAVIQRKQAQIVDLQEQLNNRPWILQREEVEPTDTKLGGGAYGEVRVAIFRGTRVAAKCLHEIIVSDYNIGVFTREMEISARIHHPNIVQFIGATRVDNPILLYELMATSLHKQLQEGRPLTHPQIITIASNICSAMCYLHQWRTEPIIHRDISSPNVLMEPLPNDKWKAKLSDFGSANLQLRIKTVIPGNPAYAAPEARYPEEHSPAMDVYSFGVLLTEMTLHRVPEMDSSKRYRSAQDIDWSDMREIVLKCINNDRTQRLTSMEILNTIQRTFS